MPTVSGIAGFSVGLLAGYPLAGPLVSLVDAWTMNPSLSALDRDKKGCIVKRVILFAVHLFLALSAIKEHHRIENSVASSFIKRMHQGALVIPLMGVGNLLEQASACRSCDENENHAEETAYLIAFLALLRLPAGKPLIASTAFMSLVRHLHTLHSLQTKFQNKSIAYH